MIRGGRLVPACLLVSACTGLLAGEAERMIEYGKGASDAQARIRYFSEAIRLAPQLWRAWASRARAHLATNAFNAAVADATQAIELAPGEWQPWAIRGNAKLALHDFNGAAADATEGISRRPGQADFHGIRAEAYRKMGKLVDAADDATTALMIDPRSRQALATRGAARMALGKRHLALEDFNTVISLYTGYLWAIKQRARLLADMKRYRESIEDCERLASLRPDDPEPLALKARVLASQGKFDDAIAVSRKAIRLAPKSAMTWLLLGNVQSQAKMWEQAMASYNKGIALKPDFALGYAHRAEACRLRRDYASAISDATQALTRDPSCVFAYATRGAALAALEEWDSAITDLSAAIDRQPPYRFALNVRTRAYRAKQDWTHAIADAKTLVQLAADDEEKADAHLMLGAAYRGKGLFRESLKVLSDAIKLAPGLADAYFVRANTHRMSGKPQLAIADCDAGIKVAPESAFGHLLRGVSYFQMSEYALARRDIELARHFDRDNEWLGWAYAYLAEIARQEKLYDASISHATQALAAKPKLAHPMAYVVRAASGRAKGLYREAVDDATQGIRLRKGFAYAYAVRGAARSALREYGKAIDDCNRAISLMPFLELAYYERGYALLCRYQGEGVAQKESAAMLPAIMTGLGGLEVPFELAKTKPTAARTGQQPRASVIAPTARAYEPEPIGQQTDTKKAHPLDRAVADFRMLLSMDYSRSSSACGLARCLHAMGRFREAEAACSAELARSSDDIGLYVARAMARYALGEVTAGLADARRAVAAKPKQPEALLTLAYGEALAGRWLKCRGACEQALSSGRSRPTAARILLLWFAANMHETQPRGSTKARRRMMAIHQDPHRDWPVPLLSALAAGQTLEEFAAHLPKAAKPHVMKSRLCQACYYFAAADLGAGRIALAKTKLKRCVSFGAGHNIEFSLANAELRGRVAR